MRYFQTRPKHDKNYHQNDLPSIARISTILLLLILAFPALTGLVCENPITTIPTSSFTPIPSETAVPEAMVTFRVTLPESITPGVSINLNVLDEVTGLALNQKAFPMEAEDSQHFVVILPFPINSVLKYRYTRQGAKFTQEHTSDGRSVRYRLYLVEGPGIVQDVISRWTDTNFNGPTGRINGQVIDTHTGKSIPDILVTAGGAQTLTTADGAYLLEGLPPGTHNIVAYSLDGSYRAYQQGAIVAGESTTPAPLHLTKATMVKIVFTVNVPRGTLPAVPIRYASNLYQHGNTFADLEGGVNTLASRMPVLSPLPDGRYMITLDLPAGVDIRYKYTLGDGLWNAEHKSTGEFKVRQLIVPDAPTNIKDQIDTWSSGNSAPITFDITVPENTPSTDRISIQLNPSFGWTEPLPMWSVGKGRWIFVLYSPLDTLGTIGYRYCRNEQCGSGDNAETMGPYSPGKPVETSLVPIIIDDPVTSWAWLPASTYSPPKLSNNVTKHGSSFIAGVEFQAYYEPSWQSYIPMALDDVISLKANWVVLTPTWTFTRTNLPVLEPLPGHDPLWADMTDTLIQARTRGLNVALFPTPIFPGGKDSWWENGTRDFAWWNVWYEHYHTFILHYADMATIQGIQALIIGGEWVNPALPNGTLPNGKPSNVPADAEVRWQQLIKGVRDHFKGTLLWALPFPQGVKNPPVFLNETDMVYLLWNAELEKKPGGSEKEMTQSAVTIFEENLRFFQPQVNKPIVIGLAYPSAQGGATGCIPAEQGGCLPLETLSRPNPDVLSVNIDMQDQANAYAAMLRVLDGRNWVTGVIARGYYPPVLLQDKSTSIRGKLASYILAYWFPRLLGITP